MVLKVTTLIIRDFFFHQDAHKVTLEDFCDAMEIPQIGVNETQMK